MEISDSTFLHTVSLHEWQRPSTGQAVTMRLWRRDLLEDTLAVDLVNRHE